MSFRHGGVGGNPSAITGLVGGLYDHPGLKAFTPSEKPQASR